MTKEAFSNNAIVEGYYEYAPAIPQRYLNLLHGAFQIQSSDRIIDLGCGSGEVAASFAQTSFFVEGLDSSQSMIEEATKKRGVNWRNMPVQEFDFGEGQYDLIFTYEAFHLFPYKEELIRKIARGLKKGGIFGVGYAMYAFDYDLKDPIEEVFTKNGIPWENWADWTCPELPGLVEQANVGLLPPQKKRVRERARISTNNILGYLANVSKTASLEGDLKTKMFRELSDKAAKIYPSGESVGYDKYSLLSFVKN